VRFVLLTLILLSFSSLSGCSTPRNYMGIDISARAPVNSIIELARRAQAGDKQAQFELGMAYEEGQLLPRNLRRAVALYRLAAAGSSGRHWIYSPPSGAGQVGRVVAVDVGQRQSGLVAAQARLTEMNMGAEQFRGRTTRETASSIGSAPDESDISTAINEFDNEPCRAAIDICDISLGRSSYTVNILACRSLARNRVNCVVEDVVQNRVHRTCRMIMRRVEENGATHWRADRGQRGRENHALLVESRIQGD
jgi:hypothetical protein